MEARSPSGTTRDRARVRQMFCMSIPPGRDQLAQFVADIWCLILIWTCIPRGWRISDQEDLDSEIHLPKLH